MPRQRESGKLCMTLSAASSNQETLWLPHYHSYTQVRMIFSSLLGFTFSFIPLGLQENENSPSSNPSPFLFLKAETQLGRNTLFPCSLPSHSAKIRVSSDRLGGGGSGGRQRSKEEKRNSGQKYVNNIICSLYKCQALCWHHFV